MFIYFFLTSHVLHSPLVQQKAQKLREAAHKLIPQGFVTAAMVSNQIRALSDLSKSLADLAETFS